MGKLSEDQDKFYEENGYIILDILTTEEIEQLSREYDGIFQRKSGNNTEATWGGNWIKNEGENVVDSIHGLQMHSAAFGKLLFNDNLLDACESVMKSPNILLHHTKAHTKPPGKGSPFPMHQDYHYFPHKHDSLVAVFLNMDDSSPENGGLCIYPGSHKLGPQEDVSDNPAYHYLDDKKFPISKATPLTIKKGQMIIFSYLLIHGSYPNTSERVRRMFLIQLMTAEDIALKEHKRVAQGLVLRGINTFRPADIKKRSED